MVWGYNAMIEKNQTTCIESVIELNPGSTYILTGAVSFPAESPNITQVGGTTLTTDGSGNYLSETVWNWGWSALTHDRAARIIIKAEDEEVKTYTPKISSDPLVCC